MSQRNVKIGCGRTKRRYSNHCESISSQLLSTFSNFENQIQKFQKVKPLLITSSKKSLKRSSKQSNLFKFFSKWGASPQWTKVNFRPPDDVSTTFFHKICSNFTFYFSSSIFDHQMAPNPEISFFLNQTAINNLQKLFFRLALLFLRQVSGIKYLNKMSTFHLACDNQGFTWVE